MLICNTICYCHSLFLCAREDRNKGLIMNNILSVLCRKRWYVKVKVNVAVYHPISMSSIDSKLSPPSHLAFAHCYQLNSVESIQPGFAYQQTQLINQSCHHCFHWWYCLLLWYDKPVGWHISDFFKVPTMADLAGTQTDDLLIIEHLCEKL